MLPYILSFCLSGLLFSASLMADQSSDDTRFNDALTVEAQLTLDFLRNIKGGVEEQSTILGNVDLIFELDTQKAGLWNNGTFFSYFLGSFSSNNGMSHYAGDFQVSSNIEADEGTRLYQFWYEHSFSNQLSVLVGLHDYNSEFNTLEFASLFMNSSFGIQADISQLGPSIFPSASLAARVKFKPTQESYILAAVYDGVAGDPHHDKTTSINLDRDYGAFFSVELGLTEGEVHRADYYKLAFGSWYHTAKIKNYAADEDDKNRGIYLIVEKTLFSSSSDSLGAFLQLGFTDSKRNQIAKYYGAGLNYKGLFSKEGDDLLGLAVASAVNAKEFEEYSQNSLESAVDSAETVIELTYESEIYSWLVVQPNIQYIINPSMDRTIENAFVVGARVRFVY